jgi:hypothetical protein
MPLALRWQRLALQYVINLKSNQSNPANSCVFTPCCKALFDATTTAVPTTGIKMQQQLSETGINLDCIARSDICAVLPWLLRSTTFTDLLTPVWQQERNSTRSVQIEIQRDAGGIRRLRTHMHLYRRLEGRSCSGCSGSVETRDSSEAAT